MTQDADAQRLAEDQRLWEHIIHENTTMFERCNLFLVGQSLFAVAFTTLLTSDKHVGATRLVGGFGVALAFTWLYVCHRHLMYYRVVQERAAQRLPEYAETRALWNRGPVALVLIAYLLPALSAALWVALLAIT
ncbi:hypothetical protein [Streptomyces sp. NPDC016845]|uniref:hypothetical protein n=1 Tax=Streptomyces sp. NPDC016845 TaxID=3364972 RepID=UPI0037B6ECA6